jgi:hypothetical protein
MLPVAKCTTIAGSCVNRVKRSSSASASSGGAAGEHGKQQGFKRHEKALGSLQKCLADSIESRMKTAAQMQKTLGGIAIQEMKEVDKVVQNIVPFTISPRKKNNHNGRTTTGTEEDIGVMSEGVPDDGGANGTDSTTTCGMYLGE